MVRAAASLVLATVFLAPGWVQPPAVAAEVELTVWDWHEPRLTLTKRYAEEYRKAHPNVQFAFSIPGGRMDEKLAVALAAGAPPDIVQLHNEWAGRFTDALEPYPRALFPRGDLRREHVLFDMTSMINNEVYFLPAGLMNGGIYYYTDKLQNAGYQEPPTRWTDFITAARRLTRRDADGRITQGGFGILSDFMWLWTDVNYQYGGFLFREEGGVTFQSEPSRKAFTVLLDIVRSDVDVGGLSFDEGTLAMKYNWTWYEAFAQRLGIEYGVGMIPTPTGGSLPARGRMNVEIGVGVPASISQEHKDEAFKFIAWLFNHDDFMVELNRLLGTIPSRRSLWSREELVESPAMRMLMEQAPATIFPGPVSTWYWELLGEASNRLL
ncbi:MAG TPA: extracellular solute-binding protein, partial [Limnochordia bacterium]